MSPGAEERLWAKVAERPCKLQTFPFRVNERTEDGAEVKLACVTAKKSIPSPGSLRFGPIEKCAYQFFAKVMSQV
jgi:hypothetical protein